MTRLLRAGDRIRLKVRTVFGFKGLATVAEDQTWPGGIVAFIPDGADPSDGPGIAMRHEVALVRR